MKKLKVFGIILFAAFAFFASQPVDHSAAKVDEPILFDPADFGIG